MAEMLLREDFELFIEYGQIYVGDLSCWLRGEFSFLTDALTDARVSGRWVGMAGGVLDLRAPGVSGSGVPFALEVWSADPPSPDVRGDAEMDLDFDAPTGSLMIESPTLEPIQALVPAGSYRARVSAYGLDAALDSPMDQGSAGLRYGLQLWPRDASTAPVTRISWSGWDRISRDGV